MDMGKTVFLDLREDGLSFYSFRKNGKSRVPEETAFSPVAEDLTFAVEKKFGDVDDAYLSLPLSLLNFRLIELPFSDVKKIREVIPFEMEGLILGDPKDFVFDARPVRQKDSGFEVLVAYLAKDVLRKILGGLRSAGLDPRVATSLELKHVLDSSASGEEIMTALLKPDPLSGNDRASRIAEEVAHATIDLRRDEFAFTADKEKMTGSLKVAATLGLLLFFMFLSDTALTIISTKSENRSLRDEIRRTYQGMFPGDKRVTDEIYQTKSHLKELREKENAYVGISPLRLLLDLTRVAGPGATFSEVTADRELIALKGECPSLSDAQRIKAQLEEFLVGVTISETKPSSQNRTQFTIVAKGLKP